MRMVKPVRMLWALGIAAVGLLPLAGPASAQSTYATDLSTERGGSILIYPKVIWDGTRDTIIRISNTSNSMAHVHCFFVNGAQQCNETDFDMWLTRQQPTAWVASIGRPFTASGLVPGLIPPVPQGFFGELKCVQVDDSLAPSRANSLTGQATLINAAGDVSEYNALSFQGNPDMGVPGGWDLSLDLTPANPGGAYSACPAVLLFDHFAERAPDMVDPTLLLSTELTLVPCQEDLENQVSSSRVVNFDIVNEFESHFSVPLSFSCYFNAPLVRIGGGANPDRGPFTIGSLLSQSAYSRITSSNGGVIGLAEEFRGGAGAAAFNLVIEGYQAVSDHIILPQP